MESLVFKLTAYLHDVLGISVSAMAWKGVFSMPLFLREQYRFYLIDMLDTSCLLMIANSEEELTPATVLKQWKAAGEFWPDEIIYVTEVCSAYNRKRLIEHKVPFIVPGNQMYLPMLGMDLRENFKTYHAPKRSLLSPMSQLLVMMAIKNEILDGKSPSELAKLLGCAAMSMTRAARELEGMELVSIYKDGRKQQIKFNAAGKELWQMAKEKMVNPVRRRVWVKSVPEHWQGLLAGESALAQYSMIGEPKYPVYALTSSDWKSISRNMAVEEITHPESGCAQFELWRYSPERLAEEGCVDRYSLWLSMQDSKDERIEMALENLMEANAWQ